VASVTTAGIKLFKLMPRLGDHVAQGCMRIMLQLLQQLPAVQSSCCTHAVPAKSVLQLEMK
jgi:hypothetical protein